MDGEHTVFITYGYDGLSLVCPCEWTFPLGYAPTPADAWEAEQKHRRDVYQAPMSTGHHPAQQVRPEDKGVDDKPSSGSEPIDIEDSHTLGR